MRIAALLSLGLLVMACEDAKQGPTQLIDDDSDIHADLHRTAVFLTENIPVDGAVVFAKTRPPATAGVLEPLDSLYRLDGVLYRGEMAYARERRFGWFLTESLDPENFPNRAAVFTADRELADALKFSAGFPLPDGKLFYRADRELPPMWVMAAADALGSYGNQICGFSDYQNPPSNWDFVSDSARAQEFRAHLDCVTELMDQAAEENRGAGETTCVVITWPVWNPDSETYDILSELACNQF